MHSNIEASLPDEMREQLLHEINRLDELSMAIMNAAHLIWMVSGNEDLSPGQSGAFRALEKQAEGFSEEVTAIADAIGRLTKGAERYPPKQR